ncbi:MAG: glycosyltransferase, partial [Bacillota bacterium]
MGITIDKVDDGLPISVIVPLSNNRKDFFENMVLPLLEANNPNEIIINNNAGTAPKKRNDGFKKSTQPYIFFCDDDILLPANYLNTLYDKLIQFENQKDIGYTYTGYQGIVMNPKTHPFGGNFVIKSNSFNGDVLKRGNYISTMSLMKRDVFPFFDEKLTRFQDWDLYLTLWEKNISG